MIPKKAVVLALKNGWEPEIAEFALYAVENGNEEDVQWQRIGFDPVFWQALGRALGWPLDVFDAMDEYARDRGKKSGERHWLLTPHSFLEVVLLGGNTEEFWQQVLDGETSQK